jgi:hypothetical protein
MAIAPRPVAPEKEIDASRLLTELHPIGVARFIPLG